MMDGEAHLHICEVKLRLTPAQRERLDQLARERDAPRGVVGRELLLRALAEAEDSADSLATPSKNRRAA